MDRAIGVNAPPSGRKATDRRNRCWLCRSGACNQNRGGLNSGLSDRRCRHGLFDDANDALARALPGTRSVCRGLPIGLPGAKTKPGKHERTENGRKLPGREQGQGFGLDEEPDEREARKQGQACRRDDAGETD